MLERVRIVLVRPSGPANIGACCRAMANMGVSQLVIVAPRCDIHDPQAVAYASNAQDVLKAARVVPQIPEALSGCVATFAATARDGLYRRQMAVSAASAAGLALDYLVSGNVALAFGPEDRGFLSTELLHFDRVLTIPADPAYPVLNLAAAVMVVCYELRQAAVAAAADETSAPVERDLADEVRTQAMFRHLFDALEGVGFFLDPQSPDKLKYGLRHALGRIDLSVNECDILSGMARQIRWYVDHHPRRVDVPDVDPPDM